MCKKAESDFWNWGIDRDYVMERLIQAAKDGDLDRMFGFTRTEKPHENNSKKRQALLS